MPARVGGTPATDSDGTIYFGSADHNLYAIGKQGITVQPTAGHVKTKVTVSGTGFKPSSKVTMVFDLAKVAIVLSDTTGAFAATFRVPANSTAGGHTATASDKRSGLASVTFTVLPAIKLSLKSGTAGTSVAVNGTGFCSQFAGYCDVRWDTRYHCDDRQ